MIHPAYLLRSGGSWLAAARAWLQRHKKNGDTVTWGSDEALRPAMTAKEIESVAAEAVAEMMQALHRRMLWTWSHCGYTERHESPEHDYILLVNPRTLHRVRVYMDGAVFPAGAEADGLADCPFSKGG